MTELEELRWKVSYLGDRVAGLELRAERDAAWARRWKRAAERWRQCALAAGPAAVDQLVRAITHDRP